MDDDVRAKSDRTLQIGAQEGVVHNQHGIAFAGNFGDGGNVRDAHGWICGGLDIEHTSVGAHRGKHQTWRRGIHEAEFEPEMDQELRGKAIHAAIHRFG